MYKGVRDVIDQLCAEHEINVNTKGKKQNLWTSPVMKSIQSNEEKLS